jgi:hypothetical protein
MSLRSNKGILSSSQHLSTEITPEGLYLSLKFVKNNTGSYSKQPRVVLRAVWIVSNYNGI